jgi:hypothetical protein
MSGPSPATHRRLIVISRALWPAHELATNTLGFEVQHSPGLFLPSTIRPGSAERAAWWMPCSYATRLRHTGVTVDLAAPGPRWLLDVPAHLLGREVHLVSVDTLLRIAGEVPGLGGMFVKLAEAKDDAFPAAWRTREQLIADLEHAGLPSDSRLHWTSTRLDLAAEYRCYIRHDQVVAHSLYLRTDRDGNQTTYYDDAPGDAGEAEAARAFAAMAAEEIATARPGPAGYVLDVGYDRTSGQWLVIEANPAWSSAWYGCDIDAVVQTIAAACHGPFNEWRYHPDPLYAAQARKRGPLR